MLVNLPSPHLRAPTCPFTPKVLRTKERALTPFLSIVFTFGLTVQSIKEFGGASHCLFLHCCFPHIVALLTLLLFTCCHSSHIVVLGVVLFTLQLSHCSFCVTPLTLQLSCFFYCATPFMSFFLHCIFCITTMCCSFHVTAMRYSSRIDTPFTLQFFSHYSSFLTTTLFLLPLLSCCCFSCTALLTLLFFSCCCSPCATFFSLSCISSIC